MIGLLTYWSNRTGLPVRSFCEWAGLPERKYYRWKKRKGTKSRHNGKVPMRHSITEDERSAIEAYARQHDLIGYPLLS